METEELKIADVEEILANPFYAIQIHPTMALKHKTIITEDEFIKVGVLRIKQDGDGGEKYLRQLLENLKGNYPE